jgi:hypothetical protein
MNDLYLFTDHDIPEKGKEGENCRHRRLAINDEEGDVVHFETIGKISNSCPPFVCMSDDNDFMTAVDQFLE